MSEPNPKLSLMLSSHLNLHNVQYFCEYSHFVESFASNGLVLSPVPELEVPQQNPNHLHWLVSEGDVRGVRFVGATANLA